MISELKDKQGSVNIDLKIIYDQIAAKETFGKLIKTVIVVDVDNATSTPSALLDLYNDDCAKFKFQDKIRVTNAYAKLAKTDKNQFRITYAEKVELIR